jgi:pimeloyl-ACP methyl ester carboxylesterase
MCLVFEGYDCRNPAKGRVSSYLQTDYFTTISRRNDDEMADHSTSMLSIDGCRVRLMRGGSGAPMLFLHGGGGVGIWLPCMARLAKKLDVIAPEHPGFGESDTPEWLDTIGDLANFYLEFLDQLDLRGVHLVGSSLGGWIAAELAVRNASRLASLTLVGAAGIHVKDVAQVDPFLNTEEQRIRDLFYDQELAEAVVASTERPELQDAALKNLTATARLAWQPRNHDPHLRKWLHRIKLPTLLIWGADDRLFPREYAFVYQQLIPGSKAVILPECGHLPHVEKGDAFAAELEAFIGTMRIAA